MHPDELVSTYLQKRGELASAVATPYWRMGHAGHIQRVSHELSVVELALEDAQVDAELLAALFSGRLG